MKKKYLFCKKCLEYPDEIYEQYEKPVKEWRKWNGEEYEIESSSLDMAEFTDHCAKCKSRLEVIKYEDLPKETKAKMVLRKV